MPLVDKAAGALEKRAVTPDELKFISGEKLRIILNVVLISGAFMINFTAFQGTGNIQSSINPEYGAPSMAAIYGSVIFFSLFLPPIITRWLGCKLTMSLMFMAYIPYVLAQMHFTFYTMLPSAILVGLGSGTLWCAKCTYLSIMADNYSELTGISSEVLTVRFFGIFFMIFQLCQVWGNLITSSVFSMSSTPMEKNANMVETCGAAFCLWNAHETNNTNMARPSDIKIMIVVGTYTGCIMLAILMISLGVDSLTRYGEKERLEKSGKRLTSTELIASIMQLWLEPRQLLMIVMSLWTGVEQAYLGAEYTKDFVSCAWGIQNIGYVMICYGLCNSVSAICTGWLVKITGRVPVVSAAYILHICLCVYMLHWHPNSEKSHMFFVLSGLWGLCDGVWLVQINAMCGIIFPGREEAAYSNFRVWQSLGSVVSYSYSNLLCNITKLCIVIGLLSVGMVGYLWVEMWERKKKRNIIKNEYSIYRHFRI